MKYKALLFSDMILFPEMAVELPLDDKINIATVKSVLKSGKVNEVAVVFDGIYSEAPTYGETGLICKLVQIKDKKDTADILIECVRRCEVNSLWEDGGVRFADVSGFEDILPPGKEGKFTMRAFSRVLKKAFFEFADLETRIPPEIVATVRKCTDFTKLCDIISPVSEPETMAQYDILSAHEVMHRGMLIRRLLEEQTAVMKIADEIESRTHFEMDKDQRDYYLRTQLESINEELYGGGDDEYEKLQAKVSESRMPEESKEKLRDELRRLRLVSPTSPEANVIRSYVEYCVALPWGVFTDENRNLRKAREILDRDHYGLDDVKERIIEMIAARILSDGIKGQIICLVGPPGVGKTSVAKSVAAATGRNYQRIALGGIRDESEIRGHRRTYIGAVPGRITNALIDAKSANPLVLLDEIDKMASDYRGDPAAAMLEVLDPEQNNSFVDHFIDLPFDLSQVLFLCTANTVDGIPAPLLDRMDIIELNSYTAEEKFNIAKKHLIPKQMKEHSLDKSEIRISPAAVRLMISAYTREAGVRQLERLIAKLCRKCSVNILNNGEGISVTEKNLESFLGAAKFKDSEELKNEVGLVNGLAWTSVGGELLQVETSVVDGTGKLELTGSLGDVMKESAKAAVTYVRSKAAELGIDGGFAKDKDIHIHVPEGAVPKDGPSAGVTITTSLVSALTGRPVNSKIAMTGEVTLRGRVLPIGGLREKSMAAYKHGVTTVIIPAGNTADLEKIDAKVREKVEFVPVSDVGEVLAKALL